MASLLRFHKWFADVLTSDGDYLIVFHVLLRVAGIQLCFMEVNLSAHTGNSAYHLNRKIKVLKWKEHRLYTREGDMLYDKGQGKISFTVRGLDFQLNYLNSDPPGVPEDGMILKNNKGEYLEWKALMLKAEVEGMLNLDMGGRHLKREVRGTGYVDHLYSNMLPFRIPVSQLYWGRLHHPDLDLTYSYALGAQNQVLSSLMRIRRGQEIHSLEDLELQPGKYEKYGPSGFSCPHSYTLKASGGNLQLILRVVHVQTAIISDFLENPKELGRTALSLLRRLSSEPKGIKFHSRGSIEYEVGGHRHVLDAAEMIDEYVRFK